MDKVLLKFGPLVALPVVVKTATEDDSKDTALKTVCIGKPGADPHPPVKVNGLMRCSHAGCEREERSYHPYPRGRDNGDGTYTVLKAEDLAAAVVDRDLVETITLTKSPIEDVENQTLPFGRFYWLAPGKGASSYDTFVTVVAEETDFAYLAQYARSTAPANYRIVAHGNLLALQELATPAQLKQRPAVDVPAANPVEVAQLKMLSKSLECEFDPANFADTRKAVIAAALAASAAEAAGEETPLATVTQLPSAPAESQFAAALRALGMDPEAATPAAPKRKRASKKVEAPPVQPLPSEVPANVDTTLAAPKKAPRKTAAKKSA